MRLLTVAGATSARSSSRARRAVSSRRALVLTAAVLLALAPWALAACSSEPFSTVEIGLSTVPPSVTSVTVVVRRGEELVVSATVPPSRASISLGVPAEIPLEFTVLARTNRPGPAGIGRMPAYVGRVLRSIPLAADATRVAVTLRPAGVLTVIAPPAPEGAGTTVHVVSDEAEAAGVVLRAREDGFVGSYVVRAGTFRARSDDERFVVDAPGRIFVARESESVFVLSLREFADEPVTLDLDIPELLEALAEEELTITATGADHERYVDPDAEVAWRIDTAPVAGGLVTPDGDAAGTLMGLPADPIALVAVQATRAWVHVKALLGSGVEITASRVVEVQGARSGPPVAVVARVTDIDARRTGTQLLIELVDANGAYALGSTVTLDLSASDPWIDLGGAPIASIKARDRGRTLREISAPSGPRQQPLTLVVSASSTVTGFTATTTVTLQPLDLP